jgi:hypothetical protein
MTIGLIAFLFAGMGLAALARPAHIGRFFDVRFESVDGRTEVRAVYGGFGIAIAGALVLSLYDPALRAGICTCVALALAGMAGGRLFSVLIERPGFWPWFFGGLEAAGAALLFLAARSP